LFDRLNKASEDAEKTKTIAWNEIGGCLDRLDLFSVVLTEINPELGRTVKQFKEEIDSGSFTEETAETCYLLEETAYRSLRKSLKLEEIENNCLEGKESIEKIRFVLRERPAMGSESIKSLEVESEKLEDFFEHKQIVLENAIESIQSIRWRCRELKNKGKEEITSLLEEYLSKNFLLEATPIETPVAGEEFKSLYLIEFSNPFFSWAEPLNFSIPLTKKFDGLELKSQNVVAITQKNESVSVEFSSLSKGKTFAEFYSFGLVSFTVKTEIKEISSLKAEIEKTIEFDSKDTISKLDVLVPFEFGGLEYSNVRAFFKGRRTRVGIGDGSLVLTLENVLHKDKALVYLTVFEPVTFKKTVIERKEIDANQFQERVLVSIKNNLDYPIKPTSLVVPFASNSEFVELIELFDEHGAERVVRVIPDGLVFDTAGFSPGEERYWELKYRINNKTDYFKEKKEELEKRLEVLGVDSGFIGTEANELLYVVNGIGSLEFVENTNRLERLFDEMLALESKQEKERSMAEEIEFLESELTEKIGLLEKEVEGVDTEQPWVVELLELVGNAKKTLNEANKLKKTDKAGALELIYRTQAQLASFSSQDYSTEIKKHAMDLLEEINSVKEQASALGIHSVELELNSQKATELFLRLEDFVSKREYGNARALLEKMNELTENTRKAFETSRESEIESLAGKLNKFIERVELVKSKIKKLELEFSSVPEEELIHTKTILPFGKELVEGLEKEFNSVDLKYSDKFKALLFKISEGKPDEALDPIKTIGVDTALAEIGALEERASSMELRLKASALAGLASARERLPELNETGIIKLEEAVNEANKNNYLKALVLSRTALSTAKPQEFDLTLLLYPVFVVLAILSVRQLKKKKETPKLTLRRIPRRY